MDESEVCLHCGEATTTVDEGKVVVNGDSPDHDEAERRVFCSLEHAHDWQLARSSEDT